MMPSMLRSTLALLAALPIVSACGTVDVRNVDAEPAACIQYLEIVTPDVDTTCQALAAMHGVTFSEPDPSMGGARTAPLVGGGRIGVRGPLRANEDPVVRPYMLASDIEAAVKTAADAGGEIAMPPMEIPGESGKFAIYLHGGIQHGLWQL